MTTTQQPQLKKGKKKTNESAFELFLSDMPSEENLAVSLRTFIRQGNTTFLAEEARVDIDGRVSQCTFLMYLVVLGYSNLILELYAKLPEQMRSCIPIQTASNDNVLTMACETGDISDPVFLLFLDENNFPALPRLNNQTPVIMGIIIMGEVFMRNVDRLLQSLMKRADNEVLVPDALNISAFRYLVISSGLVEHKYGDAVMAQILRDSQVRVFLGMLFSMRLHQSPEQSVRDIGDDYLNEMCELLERRPSYVQPLAITLKMPKTKLRARCKTAVPTEVTAQTGKYEDEIGPEIGIDWSYSGNNINRSSPDVGRSLTPEEKQVAKVVLGLNSSADVDRMLTGKSSLDEGYGNEGYGNEGSDQHIPDRGKRKGNHTRMSLDELSNSPPRKRTRSATAKRTISQLNNASSTHRLPVATKIQSQNVRGGKRLPGKTRKRIGLFPGMPRGKY